MDLIRSFSGNSSCRLDDRSQCLVTFNRCRHTDRPERAHGSVMCMSRLANAALKYSALHVARLWCSVSIQRLAATANPIWLLPLHG